MKLQFSTAKRFAALAGAACALASAAALADPVWHPFAVHGGSTTVAAGTVTFDANPLVSPFTWSANGAHGAKAFYGTDFYDGQSLSVLSNYTLTYGPGNPYLNIYVTDGVNTAALLALATNVIDIDTVQYQVFESTGGSLVNGSTVSWATLMTLGLSINTDGVYDNLNTPENGWASWGAAADGITLGWGNTGGSTLYAVPAVILVDPNFVPEPGTLALLGLGLLGLAARRRSTTA